MISKVLSANRHRFCSAGPNRAENTQLYAADNLRSLTVSRRSVSWFPRFFDLDTPGQTSSSLEDAGAQDKLQLEILSAKSCLVPG